ncbi:MAG: PAS domain S-box protein [Desulfobacterales bacterium]|nr:PAS domain S-box protein [Desulfobacterales bacterium]
MSLLPEKSKNKNASCWEYLSCTRILCPAHGTRDKDCWLIPMTHCNNSIEEDFFKKLPSCLECPYFKKKGKECPTSWNHFLADQLQKYNCEVLEQKEESFVEILNRIPDGVFTTDREWRITYFNPAAEKITGFSAYDAVGMYCKDVFKNSICETDCVLKRAVAEGRDIHNRECEITNTGGEKIPVICSTSAFLDNSGRITGGLEIFKDITDLKKLHAEIAAREKKYSRIFEGSHDMIYTTNKRGDILNVNQAGVDMLGYKSKEEMMGLASVKDLYRNPEHRDKFLKIIDREGYAKDFGVDFKKRDGTPVHVLISSRRYENPETGYIEYEGRIKDITHRKYTEEILKQRNWELSVLNRIAVALNLTTDLNHILKVTLDNVLKVLKLENGAIFLIDREKKKAGIQVKHGLPPEDPDDDEIIFKDIMLKKNIIEEDITLMPRATFPGFMVTYPGKAVPWLLCFLITFKGNVTGFIGLDMPDSRELNNHELHLLGSLGNFLGGTIENARLIKTIAIHRRELRKLTGKLFQSQEEERRRIARELHDEAGQALTAIKLGLDRMEEKLDNKDRLKQEISEVRKMISRTSSEIRQISYHLHPTLLNDLGLEPALNLYFKEMEKRSNLDIDFRMVGFNHRLEPDMETVFYRFSQEALTNTLNHSGAENFRVSVIKSYPRIIFIAEDDGVGFDGQVGGDKRSLGLIGMRERASLLGGTFQLRSKLGQGTRIRIEIPFIEEHGADD